MQSWVLWCLSLIAVHVGCFESGPTVLKVFTGCQSCIAQEIFSQAELNDVKFSSTIFGRCWWDTSMNFQSWFWTVILFDGVNFLIEGSLFKL